MPESGAQHQPSLAEFVVVDPEILGGTPVFRGTRVPVASLFDHLADGISLSEFLDDFPYVSRAQATAVIQLAEAGLLSGLRAA